MCYPIVDSVAGVENHNESEPNSCSRVLLEDRPQPAPVMTTLSHTHPLSASPATVAVPSDFGRSVGDDLLRRLQTRDLSALEDLTQRFGQAITRTAYLQLGDAHAAEDVAQDTLLAAWYGASRTRDDTAIWPWLLGITYNRCRKHWRTLARRRRREQSSNEKHNARCDDEQSALDEHRLSQVRTALADLSAKLRIVVILRYFEGLSVRETAGALQLPEGTVKRRSHVAITKLREQVIEVSS